MSYFSKHFFLTNVLYVPNFSLNLVCVSKLSSIIPCLVNFNKSQCIIHDSQSLKTIGSTKLIEGLYHLVLLDKILNVFSASCNFVVIITRKCIMEF